MHVGPNASSNTDPDDGLDIGLDVGLDTGFYIDVYRVQGGLGKAQAEPQPQK